MTNVALWRSVKTLFLINGMGQLNIYIEEIKLDPYISPYTKIISRGNVGLNVNGKNIKLLEDNMGEHLHNFKVGKYFLNGTHTKKTVIKENTEKLDPLKFLKFCSSKDTIKIWEVFATKSIYKNCS